MRVAPYLCLLWLSLMPAQLPVAYADEQDIDTDISLSGESAVSSELPMADRVVVRKSARKLVLLHRGEILREYPVHLGLQPEGPKQAEGDFRTPEGHYQLGRRNPQSSFFLSVQVSYPNDQDLARAQRKGIKPGGAIMVHGLPNAPSKSASRSNKKQLTNSAQISCAVSQLILLGGMTKVINLSIQSRYKLIAVIALNGSSGLL